MLSERESLFEGQVLDVSNENEKTRQTPYAHIGERMAIALLAAS